MKNTKASIRYAKSLFDLAAERGVLQEVNTDAKTISEAVSGSHDLTLLLNSPVVKSDKKTAVLKALFEGKVNGLSLNFIQLLSAKRREGLLSAIMEEFSNLYNKHRGIVRAEVITASGLDEKLRAKVLEIVKNSAKSEVELIEKTDNNIIGGFILKIGSNQYDSSVLRSIRNLKQTLQ